MKLRILALPLALGCVLTAASARPAHTSPTPVVLPDLVPWPGSLHDYFVDTKDGRRLLRFSSGVVNEGRAPLQLRGTCPRPASTMPVFQDLFNARGQKVRKVKIGQATYVAAENHWHVVNIAQYRLLDLSGHVIAASDKASFCLIDEQLAEPDLPKAKHYRVYGSCPYGKKRTSLKVGLSIGWADIYEWQRDGQSIDITGVPSGNYQLQTQVDPDGNCQEADYTNNTLTIPVTI